MNKFIENIGIWIGIISGIVGILSAFNNRVYVAILCTALVGLVIFVSIFSNKKDTSLYIEGLDISDFNRLSLFKNLNKSLKIEKADRLCKINGKDLITIDHFTGEAKKRAHGLEFIFATGSFAPIEDLKVIAYDLLNGGECVDCELLSAEGLIKKVFVPFNEQIKKHGQFDIEISRTANDSMVYGLDYAYYRIPFKHSFLKRKTQQRLTLEFPILDTPSSVRVYSVNSHKKVKRLGIMKKTINQYNVTFTYENVINVNNTIIVFFNREKK